MQRAAVDKAKDRLESAKARLKELESSKGYQSARRCWYEFLLASNAVFSVLEQGAKGFDKSENWFGRRKHERRSDPLLCYLLHARNADEHNIPSVTELEQQKIVLVEDGKPTAAIEQMIGHTGKFRSISGQSVNLQKINEIRIYPDRAKLIPVRDRGIEYQPPTTHLGLLIEDGGPIEIAQLMVRYIEAMINEANNFTA